MTAIVWFRQDLRLDDHPALRAAVNRGEAVVPVYIWSPGDEGDWAPGAASRWWLHHSLFSLDDQLKRFGSRLILRSGTALDELSALIGETGATAVFWSRRVEPAAIKVERAVERMLSARGVMWELFNTSLLHDPATVRTKSGGPYQVFTPFWKALQDGTEIAQPIAAPRQLAAPRKWPKSLHLEQLELLPTPDWASGFGLMWSPGEAGAQAQTKRLLGEIADYDSERDRPDRDGTSRLSPHLHFGEVSPRRVWAQVIAHETRHRSGPSKGALAYLRQLAWREFAHHLLHHFPQTPARPLRDQYSRFPWRRSSNDLRAWQRGLTGYPYVDAGMRQLWSTGWMHNRVRMLAASLLVKHLLLDWRHGAAWFWDTLVDADLANNTLGWQWCAGCGADAAPYFRIFNPVTQGRKFDPQGRYVRTWVPELSSLPDEFIHRPWEAPAAVLRAAGVALGRTYPHPIVSHEAGRRRALEALSAVKVR